MNFLISSPVLKAAAHTSEPFLDEFYYYLLVQESALRAKAAFFATSGVVFFQRAAIFSSKGLHRRDGRKSQAGFIFIECIICKNGCC